MQRLAAISEILGVENITIDRFFLKLKKPVDTLQYIKAERLPSYHLDKNCTALTKEYENYRIPEDIRILGKEVVNKFRKFFLENKEEFIKNRMNFFYKVKNEFNLGRLPEDMVEITSPNSGRKNVNDVNLAILEGDLDKSIQEAEAFKNESSKNRLVINLYGNLFRGENMVDSNEEKDVLKKWSDIKNAIKSKYIFFCMIKYNPDIDLSRNFLDALGLNRCSLCSNFHDELTINFQND